MCVGRGMAPAQRLDAEHESLPVRLRLAGVPVRPVGVGIEVVPLVVLRGLLDWRPRVGRSQ